MANNATSAAGTHAPPNIPGLSEEVRNLRRPVNTNVYYSCTQQEWDALCRQTLQPATKQKATTALNKKSRAGRLHETADGEAAQTKCSACTKGNNGHGHDCYLPANSATKTCAHCNFSNKSKCNAQRAPAAANKLVVPAPVVNNPVVVAAPAPPAPFFAPPAVAAQPPAAAPPPAFGYPPIPSGPAGVAGQAPLGPYFFPRPPASQEEDADFLLALSSYFLRRDQGDQL